MLRAVKLNVECYKVGLPRFSLEQRAHFFAEGTPEGLQQRPQKILTRTLTTFVPALYNCSYYTVSSVSGIDESNPAL